MALKLDTKCFFSDIGPLELIKSQGSQKTSLLHSLSQSLAVKERCFCCYYLPSDDSQSIHTIIITCMTCFYTFQACHLICTVTPKCMLWMLQPCDDLQWKKDHSNLLHTVEVLSESERILYRGGWTLFSVCARSAKRIGLSSSLQPRLNLPSPSLLLSLSLSQKVF